MMNTSTDPVSQNKFKGMVMNKIIPVLFATFFICIGHAQTYDEFFRQKKTQKKYLLEQISALKTYISYAEKGYSIAGKGIKAIGDIKHGDFNLHNTFFKSMRGINPTVKKYSKVAAIILMQVSIVKQVHNTVKQCSNGKQLTPGELNYLTQVFNNVFEDCAENLGELLEIITGGEEQLKDDERIKRIDMLYEVMQDKNVFVQSFSHSANGLSLQRRNEQYDIKIEKKLNGLE